MNGKILNKEALKAWILSKMVTLTNNLLATTPGISAMDAAQGTVIQGQIDAINSNFGGLSFGMTEDGQPGWKDGADTVHPFNDIMECAIITWGKTDASILISNGTFVVNSPNNQMNGRGRLLKIEGYSIIALTPCTVCNLSQVSQYANPAFSKAAQNQVLATLTKDGAHCFIAF